MSDKCSEIDGDSGDVMTCELWSQKDKKIDMDEADETEQNAGSGDRVMHNEEWFVMNSKKDKKMVKQEQSLMWRWVLRMGWAEHIMNSKQQ